MIVFKNYFKIVKKHLGFIIMFTAISIGISVMNTSYTNTEQYTSIKPKLSIINYDNSTISENFVEYLSKQSEIVEVENNEKSIQDALYAHKVDSILIIPENFGTDLLNGNQPNIKIKKSTQNVSEYTELLVNRYLKIANTYSKLGMNESEIINNLNNDVKNEIQVKIANDSNSNIEKLALYYTFQNYAFLSIFIFIIGTIMCIFNRDIIKKRNNVSKLNPRKFSNQLFLGHMTLTLIIWAIYVLISFVIYKDLMLTTNAVFLILNSLCFAISATSLGYLIGCLVKNQNVISGIQNVISLGISFISGCFVPIEWIDPNIAKIGKVFPSYWFIQGNYDIVKITTFNYETILPVLQNCGIVLLFGVLYFIVGKIVVWRKS